MRRAQTLWLPPKSPLPPFFKGGNDSLPFATSFYQESIGKSSWTGIPLNAGIPFRKLVHVPLFSRKRVRFYSPLKKGGNGGFSAPQQSHQSLQTPGNADEL
jgi:hypothetical protein